MRPSNEIIDIDNFFKEEEKLLRTIALQRMKRSTNLEPLAEGGDAAIFLDPQNPGVVIRVKKLEPAATSLANTSSSFNSPAAHHLPDQRGMVRSIARTPGSTTTVFPRFDGDLTKLTSLSPLDAKEILGQVILTLARWHSIYHTVHADIKPENILQKRMTNGFYLVKLADLGSSTKLDPQGRLPLGKKSITFTASALPPHLKALIPSLISPASEEAPEEKASTQHRSSFTAFSDNSRIVRNSIDSVAEGRIAEQAGKSEQEQQELNKLHRAIFCTLQTPLESHAVYETAAELHLKGTDNSTEARDLLAQLKAGACPDDNSNQTPFSLLAALRHPYFGKTISERRDFFRDLEQKVRDAEREMEFEIRPTKVVAIIADIRNLDYLAAEEKLAALDAEFSSDAEILRGMLAKARSKYPSGGTNLLSEFEATTAAATGSQPKPSAAPKEPEPNLATASGILASIEDAVKKNNEDFNPQYQAALRLAQRDQKGRAAILAQLVEYGFEPKTERKKLNNENMFTLLVNIVTEHTKNINKSAGLNYRSAGLFSNDQIADAKYNIITAILKKLKSRNCQSLASFLTARVRIEDRGNCIEINLAEALCLQRNCYSGSQKWFNDKDYYYQGQTEAFRNIMNALKKLDPLLSTRNIVDQMKESRSNSLVAQYRKK